MDDTLIINQLECCDSSGSTWDLLVQMLLSSTALHVYLRCSLSPRVNTSAAEKINCNLHSSEARARGAMHPLCLHRYSRARIQIQRWTVKEQETCLTTCTNALLPVIFHHTTRLVLLGLTQRILFLQSCHCGDPSLRCPPREGARAGDSEERNRRELEGASLWTHSRGAQPDTQRHGRGSVSDTGWRHGGVKR